MAVGDPVAPESRRFTLRLPRPLWIFLATVVLVVAGAGLRFGIPFYRTREAIREIERAGGTVRTRRQGLTLQVVDVNLGKVQGNHATDATLSYLRGFQELEGLVITSPRVTDAGMVHLAGLTNLQSIMLSNSTVGDEGLAQLAG